MMRRSLRHALTPEEYRYVRTWTVGVLIFYGAIALTALVGLGLHLYLTDGSSQSAAAAVTTTAAAKHPGNR